MTPEPPIGITVTGIGVATAAPDVAKLALAVSALRNTVAEAREAAAGPLERMLQALKSTGVQDSEIQTRHLSISPEFDYEKGRQRPRGFRATNTIAVTVRDIGRVSEVVDGAVAAGGDAAMVHGIDFSLNSPQRLEEEARQAAFADARSKAQTLATAAGVALGAVLRIVESGGGDGIAPRGVMAMRAEAATTTPVVPGEIEITVRVEVTWAIV